MAKSEPTKIKNVTGTPKLGYIRSSLRNGVAVTYNGEGMVIPPQGRIDKVDKTLLGVLPKGVVFVEYQGEGGNK